MDTNPPSTEVPIFVDASGTRIAVTRRGRGAAVLCLHAVGHGARDFDRISDRLGARYEFIAVDWPGHGASPREAAPTSALRYAELTAGIADALGLDRFAILGNSIGGAAAIAYAAVHAARVRGMVLCNPGGLQHVGLAARIVCGHMAKRFAAGERGDKSFARGFRRYYERTVLPIHAAAERREEIIASAYDIAPRLRQGWESFARRDSDLRALMPKLAAPVLFAWARRDPLVSWSRSKRAALAAPHAQVVQFDAGHSAFLEQPQQFDAAFVGFLDSLAP